MAKYVLAYKGGGMPATEEEQNAAIAAWGAWFEDLGSAVTDPGNPFAASKAIASDGTVSDGDGGLTGYSILTADGLDAAADLAKGCPIFASGGSLKVYEAVEM